VISAVIPTFRGQARLDRNLESVAASLSGTAEPWEILVVDDGGGELAVSGKGVRVLSLPENSGYGPAVNAGAAAAKGDHLLILNDDVRLEKETVSRLRRLFPDPTLFAVVPAIRSPFAECGDEGGKAAVWRAGQIEILETSNPSVTPTFYPVGCCLLCPRAAWEELGGYKPTYAPFFWEDVDLGYRAWRKGLRVLHEPAAVCHHEGSATLRERYTLGERERISFRNRVLFHLYNVTDPGLRTELFGALAAHVLFEAIPERVQGIEDALAQFSGPTPASSSPGLTDREILARVAPR
jgi:GT2 family glycosyltransferase